MQLTSTALAADPDAWTAAGFTVESGSVTLGAVRIELRGADAGRGLLGWDFAAAPTGPLDGLPEPGTATAPAPVGPHPNGITAIDHVVAFSPDLERTVPALEAAGLDLRRRREGPTGAGSARQAFFRVGEVILEVVEHPPQAREAGDVAAPARLWGLALLTPDIDATAAAAGALMGPVKDAIQPGRRIATFTREAALGVAVAVIQ
ncbi:MAG TPA: VOC family protein [Thermoleophilaceae bacterium]|nr:VOC family protein [Thermoleophilaceae bacterium]